MGEGWIEGRALRGPSRDGAVMTALPPGLYWSEQGVINCAEHAPYEGSDTWVTERWQPLSTADLYILGSEAARCEICHKNRTEAERPERPERLG